MSSEFHAILENTINARIREFLIICLFLALVDLVSYAFLRSWKRKIRTAPPGQRVRTERSLAPLIRRTTRGIAGTLAAVLALAFFEGLTVVPAMQDIREESYICLETPKYISDGSSGRGHNFLLRWRIYVTDNGKQIMLTLPDDPVAESFPYGTYSGTIWYSEHSRTALRFEPKRMLSP